MDDHEWFRRVWCIPRGHQHAPDRQMACIAAALGAVNGESPDQMEALLAAARAQAPGQRPGEWSRQAKPPTARGGYP